MSTKISPFITSYDLAKTLAVMFMLADHIGFYFFPDEMWFRVVGRLCVPIWCFLIGYARTRDLSPSLWIGVGIVILTNLLTGGAMFPLTILVTFIIIRLVIDRVSAVALSSKESMIIICFALMLIYWPSMMLVEYGTVALILALGGYVIREGNIWARPIWFGAMILYFTSQIVVFHFTSLQMAVFAVGLVPIAMLLWRFAPVEFYGQKSKILQYAGRHTLMIYVVHLVLFKLISAYFMLDGYDWFAPVKYW
jgi:hypothetical protein